MPEIKQYTRQTQSTGLQQANASGASFGADQSGSMAQAQVAAEGADRLAQVAERRQSRLDVIERARKSDLFYNDAFEEFNRVQSEEDLINPSTPRSYNQTLREKAQEAINNFEGSADARAQFEAYIESQVGDLSRKMTQQSISAQRDFINKKAGDTVKTIVDKVNGDVSYLPQAFSDVQKELKSFSAAMFPEDELAFVEAAQQEIAMSAITSMTDVGDYTGARDLVEQYPFAVKALPVEVGRRVMSQINQGINAREEAISQTRNTINSLSSIAEEMGVDISPSQIYSAATGMKQAQSPQGKVEEFASLVGKSSEELSPSVVAKIAYGVDLPSPGSYDPNKEFAVKENGERILTEKGIGSRIKAPFDAASTAKITAEKVKLQAKEFFETGNKQAGLAAMISFQKLIDDGAAVREGDIKLSAQGVSALDNLELMMKRIDEGAIATEEQITEMTRSAEIFAGSVLQASKTFIDPYLDQAKLEQYNMLNIGLPQDAYDSVFSGIETDRDQSTAKLEKIRNIAKQNGETVEQLVERTAKRRNKTVEDIKKEFGINDNASISE